MHIFLARVNPGMLAPVTQSPLSQSLGCPRVVEPSRHRPGLWLFSCLNYETKISSGAVA